MIIITPKAPLRCKLEENMEVSPFIENRIFIKKSNTIAGDSALYVKNRNALAKPVAYGIEAVHFDSIFQAEMLIGIKYEIHQFAEKMESIRHAYALI
jgi:carbamoylphosphate synthase large subunit